MLAEDVLTGWTLAITIIAVVLVIGFLVVLALMREGRSRKVRVGLFVEREYLPEEERPADVSEWPTKHD